MLFVGAEITSQGTQQEIEHGSSKSLLALAKDDRRVVTAETERIAQSHLHLTLLRLVERQIEFGVDLGIGGGGNDGGGGVGVGGGVGAGRRRVGCGGAPCVMAKMQASASTAPVAPSK